MQNDTWLTRQEVADRYRVPVATLAKWAHTGAGPKFYKIGRFARYKLSDVTRWEEQQVCGEHRIGA